MSEQLPVGWSIKLLGDLAQVVSGGTPSRNVPDFWDDGTIPWVTPTDITAANGRYISESKDKITKLGLTSCSASMLPPGSILMTSRATLGEAKISTMSACTNQGFKSLVANKGVSSEFLYYQIQRTKQEYARFGSGSTFLEVSKKDTLGFRVLLPKEASQIKIAEVLSLVDAQIEATQALIAKQEQVRAGLMQGLFTRGVDEHGQLRPPREEAPHLYHQTELGWLPKGWGAARLLHLTSRIVDGVHHTPTYVPQGVPFITVKSLTAGRGIDTQQGNFISLSDHRVLQMRADPRAGDVLVSKDGTLGVARYVNESVEEFSIFVSVAMLRPIASLLHPAFLCEFFGTRFYEAQMGYLSAGSGLKHIHLEHFRKFVLPRPELSEQVNILEILSSADQCLVGLEDALEKLRLQKSGLMQDLLTGKVSVMPIRESAAA
ncbi:restriction endonuclease subunit S [Bradyrhizobium sp. 197]|uniref:restriction endonuclease subunit S n=1 Tax=Bradyrhizobium sp. 197 TaxID=2782663 RepID=UPI001FF7C201|nr:restriction endonuclease subunit S [Bradyrhizobium sp. 197]MCK1475052.1 restriction endonuclease subunit S [Bradyrhizobium sp. 197]